MIRWTTPTLKCTIPTDLTFDYIILTLKQGEIKVEKTIQSSEVIDGAFSVFFTQEETSKFDRAYKVEAQLNIMNGNVREATNIIEMMIGRNLHDEEI